MSTRRIQVLGCILVLVALAACTSSGLGVKKLGNKDAGSTVHISQGGTLEIALDCNPTTGYSWAIDGELPAQLEQVGEPKYVAGSNAIGAGGTDTWAFKAKAVGTGSLRLKYWRSFEPTATPPQSFFVTVYVK